MLDGLAHDLRYAFRNFAQRPGFTLAAIAILALGIGAASAIFSVAHGVLLRPLPYPESERLVRVWPDIPINKRALLALEERASAFDGVAGFGTWAMPLTEGGEPEVVSVGRVSAGHFAVLGARATLGRVFESEDHRPQGNEVAILSHGLWQRRFGGEAAVLGRQIEINGRPHTVIGVLPEGHRPLDPRWQLWTPLVVDRGHADDLDSSYYLGLVGRLRQGVTPEQAETQVQAIAWSLVEERPERFTRDRAEQARVVSLHEATVGAVRPTLLLLLIAVGAILLVACANVAHLLLSRAVGRQQEMAIRSALGADRSRLLRQLSVESLALAVAGGLAGLLLALWTFDLLLAQLPAGLPRGSEIAFDGTVLQFAVLVTLVSALLFGVTPALRLARHDAVGVSLAAGTRQGRSRQRLASALVIAQVAASAALLVTALLVVQSLVRLRSVDPGFDGEHVLSLRPVLSPARYGSQQTQQYYEQAFERLGALPGAVAVGAIQLLPLGEDNWHFPFRYEGQAELAGQPPGTSLPMANFRVVTPGYFEALAVAVPEGRAFEPWDRADSQPVGLINQTLAEQLWPGEEALGKRIDLFGDEGHRFTVVGVVGDVRQHDLAEPASPEIYWPLSQSSEFGVRSLAILLRTQGPPLELAAAARQTLRSLDPYVPITEVTSLPQVLDAQVAEPRLIAMTMSSFALLALVLGMTGVFGVVSCAVAGRVREIGIRMALGAAHDAVVREVLAGGLRLVVAGLAIGLAVAAAIARTLQRYLFAVEPGSLPIHGATVLAILLAALLALWLPARRASSVDPTIALRHE